VTMGRWLDVLLVSAIAITLLAPLVRRVTTRRFDPFEPYFLFVLAYGAMFVVRPAAMLATNSLVYVGPLRTLDVSGTFTEMLVVAWLGAVAFVVGYSLPLGSGLVRPHRPREERVDTRRLLILAGVLSGIAVAAFVVLVASVDGFRTLDAIFRLGRSRDVEEAAETYRYLWMSYVFLIPAAIVFLAVGLRTRSRALIAVFFLLAALVLLRGIPLGQRMFLLPFLGGVFVLIYVYRSARPSLRTLIVVGAVALIASTFLSDLRGRESRHESVAETVVRSTSPSRLADSVLTGPDTEMAATLALALSVIPEQLPHAYGTTVFRDLVVRPIPRSLWSGKPEVPRNELKAVLWPQEYANGTINPEFSALLYFYWDFGLVGVILGIAVYGVGARYLYEYFLRHHDEAYVQVLYSLALWFVVIGLRDSPVDTIMRAAFVVAPVWLLFRLARSHVRARRSEAAAKLRAAPGAAAAARRPRWTPGQDV
jgi:hypothetical protein